MKMLSSSLPTLFVFSLVFTTRTAYSDQKTISTGAELKALADEVANHSIHLGTTVVLTNDIDMSGITNFTGIGNFDNKIANISFRGVFDGNGYTIKNMNINTSTVKNFGLFGYTVGCTIKNVVIDSSCSVTSSEGLAGLVGGIIGYADAGTGVGETSIQNCVNMGTITGAGPSSRVGGIAGVLYAIKSPSTIVNCVNLGNIVYSGSGTEFRIGGIAGWITSQTGIPSIINCVNLGAVIGTQGSVGGIVGYSTSSASIIKRNYWLSGTSSQSHTGDATASDNYAFDASYTLTTGSALVTTLNNYVTSQSTYSLQKWGTVAFNTSGGSAVNPKLIMFLMLGTPDTPTKLEGTFMGWYTNPSLTTAWNSSTRYGSGVNATLYAKWKMNQYTVTFDSDGGSAVSSVTKDYGTSIGLSTPTKEGHKFDGWKDSSGSVYTDTYTIKASVTLTAQWTANQYTVTFDSDGGSTVSSVTKDYGTSITLSTPTKEGHKFDGWKDNSGTVYTDSYTIKGHATLIAQWSVNKYTVTFNSDGGSAVEPVIKDYETVITLSTPTREGHTFGGWKDASGSVYTDSYTIKGHVTLTAQWTVNQYTVTFDSNGGSEVPSITKDYETVIMLSTPTKEGHTFGGWKDGSGTVHTNSYTIKGHATLTAQWTVNQYTVTFNSDGGSAIPSNTSDYGTSITLAIPTKKGHTFKYWYDSDGNTYTSTYTIKENIVLTAQWSVNNYTVAFNSDGGSEASPVTEDYGTSITLAIPTKKGHTFKYWYDSDGNTYTDTYTIKENAVLTAQWTVNNYTVAFDFDNGTKIEEPFAFNDAIRFPEVAEREGYTFIEWNNTITKMPEMNITIKALWKEIPKEYVEIVFSKKDMSESEIKSIISKYSNNDNYVIEIVESGDGSTTTVIIKFNDVDDAKYFREVIEASSDADKNYVKITRFVGKKENSFSFISYPFIIYFLYLLI